MPQFFISVNHSDDFQMPEGVSIEQLHTDVMAFNEKMAAEQRIVFVGALVAGMALFRLTLDRNA